MPNGQQISSDHSPTRLSPLQVFLKGRFRWRCSEISSAVTCIPVLPNLRPSATGAAAGIQHMWYQPAAHRAVKPSSKGPRGTEAAAPEPPSHLNLKSMPAQNTADCLQDCHCALTDHFPFRRLPMLKDRAAKSSRSSSARCIYWPA